MEKNNKLGTDKEIWADKHKVSDGVREEEKTRGEIAKAKRGGGGGSIMREIEKEEDSVGRVTGCQPRMQSILGRIKETVRHLKGYKLTPVYSTRLEAATGTEISRDTRYTTCICAGGA